jgi:membrane-associated phospholipid phosphatase
MERHGELAPHARRAIAWGAAGLSGLLLCVAPAVRAQTADSSESTSAPAIAPPIRAVHDTVPAAGFQLQPATHVIRWYEAAAAVGGAAALAVVDEPLQRHAQRHRSETSDDVARFFRHMGQPEVYGTVSVGILAVGLVAHQPRLARTGGRAIGSIALAGVTTLALKTLAGRARPDSGIGAFHFKPFGSGDALPSGHTSVAFALATSLAEDIDRTWVTIGLYTAATGTAFSRINDNRHWLSDTALGALVGFTSARLVRGRWQVFGIRPPGFLLSPSGEASLGWHATF